MAKPLQNMHRPRTPRTHTFHTIYDILGRVTAETLPTLVDGYWQPTGDDNRGVDVWLWNAKQYDWKGRVTRIVPSDSNTSGDQDTILTYTNCGCAGEETVIEGPLVPRDDTSGNARRKQKVTRDIFGLTTKTEMYEWNGSTVHSTVVNTYNGRDQVTSIKEYAGTTSGTMQETTTTYDGHGRPYQKHLPQWFGSSPTTDKKYTTYTYKEDDAVATMTDPLGAVTTYKYGQLDSDGSEDRALLTRIAYTPAASEYDPADVQMSYDAAGNRVSMTDDAGTMTYAYDELSRLKTEKRLFADQPTHQPTGGYALNYNYHLTGGIKSITDQFNYQVYYAADRAGRLTSIGSSSSSPASYVASIAHRAFGGVKSMSLSTTDPVDITMAYDTGLRPTGYIAHSDANTGNIHEADYTYHNDGMLNTLVNDADPRFGQVNKYDFAGRLKENDVGSSGSGYVFIQTVGYDAFSNMTDRTTHTWGSERSFEAGYANNRKTAGGATTTYNNAGNVTYSWESNNNTYTWFDAAGRTQRWEEHLAYSSIEKKGQKTIYDGDGRPVKEVELTKTWTLPGGWTGWSELPSYYLYSSVTGQKITQLDLNGGHAQTFVNMGSTLIAQQDSSEATFHVTDPVTGSVQMVNQDGEILNGEESRTELAGLRTLVPHIQPPESPMPNYDQGGFAGNPENGCEFEGTPLPCSIAAALAQYEDQLPKPGVKPEKLPPPEVISARRESASMNSRSGGIRRYPLGPTDDFNNYVFADNVDRKRERRGLVRMRFGSVDGAGYGWMVDPAAAVADGDCERFAARVARIVALHPHNITNFVNELASVFVGVSSAGVLDLQENANTQAAGNRAERFNSTGWNSNLYDNIQDNQARHFMGGLLAGYNLGSVVGETVMNTNENSAADMRVNAISIPLGANLTAPDPGIYNGRTRQQVTPPRPGYGALPNQIRRSICIEFWR